jgi:MacB-like periplasmic core domain
MRFGGARAAGYLIPIASWLVPGSFREEWLKEWEAEFRYASAALPPWRLLRFAAGSFSDALWQRKNRFEFDTRPRRQVRSPQFCLSVLLSSLIAIVVASGGLPATRAAFIPLPYDHAERIATVAQGGIPTSFRSIIKRDWVRLWRRESKTIADLATYSWKKSTTSPVEAQVSANFFDVLGARTDHGRLFGKDACANCVVLSYDFFEKASKKGWIGSDEAMFWNGRRMQVVGVLERGFWFISRDVGVWTVDPGLSARTGVVVRFKPDVNKDSVQSELVAILHTTGLQDWASLVDVSPLQERVRDVFVSFGFAVGMGAIIVCVALRPRLGSFGAFFCGKTLLALLCVMFAGIEFTHASSITMTGGTDLSTEPISTWLFLLSSMGVLAWAVLDQRRRCRVCYSRLGLAAHVGCPGCILLDWAGTELVCMEGHGMLHVPEMASSWQEPEQWTKLDESWMALFARR